MFDAGLLLLVAAVIAVISLSILYVRAGNSKDLSLTKKRKRKLLAIVVSSVAMTIAMIIVALAIGAKCSVHEAISSLISLIMNGGTVQNAVERQIYYYSLPRVIVAVAVGIGLAISGCIYQAVIRNPLVDSYITGVSSGAGFAAIMAISTGTLFGLSIGSSFVVPIAAILGGICALMLTMTIAEKAGGSSTNYVLAGVVVGFLFAALQTLMIVFSGERLRHAVMWLYGSFMDVRWPEVWLAVIPIMLMSFMALIWARELNLVLLGEDQAKQAGLNVKRFNRSMMIFASVIAAVCVAFVGIIGFVGLVIPHLCRMVLGGDHRLVLPASIAIGGFTMVAADLVARSALHSSELPVGAITALIGVPLFAFILMKKGRMYDG